MLCANIKYGKCVLTHWNLKVRKVFAGHTNVLQTWHQFAVKAADCVAGKKAGRSGRQMIVDLLQMCQQRGVTLFLALEQHQFQLRVDVLDKRGNLFVLQTQITLECTANSRGLFGAMTLSRCQFINVRVCHFFSHTPIECRPCVALRVTFDGISQTSSVYVFVFTNVFTFFLSVKSRDHSPAQTDCNRPECSSLYAARFCRSPELPGRCRLEWADVWPRNWCESLAAASACPRL